MLDIISWINSLFFRGLKRLSNVISSDQAVLKRIGLQAPGGWGVEILHQQSLTPSTRE